MDYTGKERTGHWTNEEMEYLEAIVQEFRDGALPLKDGTTLRGYLAKQLHCGVKRVSKKMEGTEYNGRHSFVKMSFTEEEKRVREARLNVFKERFEQSVVRHERLKTARFDEIQGADVGEELPQQSAAITELLTAAGTNTTAPNSSAALAGLLPQQMTAASSGTELPMARTSWMPAAGLTDSRLNELLLARMAGAASMAAAPARFVPPNNVGVFGMNPFASLGGVSSNAPGADHLTAFLSGNLPGSTSMANNGASSSHHNHQQQPPSMSFMDNETLKRTILSLALQGRNSEPDTKRLRTGL